MNTYLTVVLILCSWFSLESAAHACTCLPTDLEQSYEYADHVVHVRVEYLVQQSSTTRRYLARLVDPDFKGCLAAGRRIVVETAGNEAACGVTLSAGEYLLHGMRVRSAFGLPTLRAALCDANAVWGDLSGDEVAFLVTRNACCGDGC